MTFKKIISVLTAGVVTVTSLAANVPADFNEDSTWYSFSNAEKNRLKQPETTITVDYVGANDGWGDVGVGGYYNNEWVSYYFPCELGENTLSFTVTELLEKISERYNEEMKEKEEESDTDLDVQLLIQENAAWNVFTSEKTRITGEGEYIFKIDDLEIDPDTLTLLYIKDVFAIENGLDLDKDYASKVSDDFSVSFSLKINGEEVAIADTIPTVMGDKAVFDFCFYNIWNDDETHITLPEETINSIELVAIVSEGEEDGENETEHEEVNFSVGDIDFQGVSAANGTTLVSVSVERSEDDPLIAEYTFTDEQKEELKKENTELVIECDSMTNSDTFEVAVRGYYNGYLLQSINTSNTSDCKVYNSIKNILFDMSQYYNDNIKATGESDVKLSLGDVDFTSVVALKGTYIRKVSLTRRNSIKCYDPTYFLDNIEGYIDISTGWGSSPYEPARDFVWEADVWDGAALLCQNNDITNENASDYMVVVTAEIEAPVIEWSESEEVWYVWFETVGWWFKDVDDCKMMVVIGPSENDGIVDQIDIFDVPVEDGKSVYTFAFNAADLNQTPETGWYSQLQMEYPQKVTLTIGYAKIPEDFDDETDLDDETDSAKTQTDNGVTVTVPDDSEATLEGKSLSVEIADSSDDSVTYNITLKDKDGNEVQPNGTVEVKIPLPEGWDAENTTVSRRESDGTLTDMNAVYEDGYMIFTTDHFSEYVLSVKKPVIFKLGDPNDDGKITTVDAKWVLQAVSGSRTLTPEQEAAANVNGDGKITTVDAKWILQAVSGSRDF